MIAVVYVVSQLGRGGQERQLLHLLKALDRNRVQPHVIAWRSSPQDVYVDRIRMLGIPVEALAARSRLGKLIQLRRRAAALRADAMHSYSFYTNFAVHLATMVSPRAAFGGIRNDFFSERRLAGAVLGRASARWPREQISNNKNAATNALRAGGFFRPRDVHVVQNATDVERLSAITRDPSTPPLLLGIGSLEVAKRWHLLLDVAAQLPNTAVTILGEGSQRTSLERRAAELGLGDRLRLPGDTEDVGDWLARAAVLVHVSAHEGQPNVVIEALTAGCPVIATAAGDTGDLISNGSTGVVVGVEAVDDLHAAVRDLLQHPSKAQAMGLAGQESARARFSPERLARETTQLYELRASRRALKRPSPLTGRRSGAG